MQVHRVVVPGSRVYFAFGLVVLLLCTSSYTYLAAVTRNGVSGATTVSIYLIGARLDRCRRVRVRIRRQAAATDLAAERSC